MPKRSKASSQSRANLQKGKKNRWEDNFKPVYDSSDSDSESEPCLKDDRRFFESTYLLKPRTRIKNRFLEDFYLDSSDGEILHQFQESSDEDIETEISNHSFQNEPDQLMNEEVEDSILIPGIPEINLTEEEWTFHDMHDWRNING